MENLIGQVSEEQIAAWKKEIKEKFGESAKLFWYKRDGRIGYLRSVDREVYSLASSKVSTSPAHFDQTIIENIWMGGDDTLRKDDRYYFGLKDKVDELIDKKKGELGEC